MSKACHCGGHGRCRKLLPYAGGKSLLAPKLVKLMPPHQCYVEVFGGGAALLAAKDPGASKIEVLNDLDGRLTTLYRVAKAHPEALELELSLQLRSRRDYREFRDQPGLTDVQRAARYLFLLRNTFAKRLSFDSFGYGTTGGGGGAGSTPRVLLGMVWRIFERLERVTIENLDFEELLRRYDRPHTFFYCDPPYLVPTQPYVCKMDLAGHERLARCLAGLKGKWVLSLNDCPTARRLYRGFRIERVQVRYGISREKSRQQIGRELLIRNYRL